MVGLSDGIIISLALSTALFAVFQDRAIILKTGSIAGGAGAILIGLGGYYAARARMESLTLKTAEEEKKIKAEETAKTIALFKKLDLGKDMQEQAASEIEKDSTEWKTLLEINEQQLEIADKRRLPPTAIIIGLSYLAGAAIPLAGYFLIDDIFISLKYSIAISLLILPIVGYTKSRINREPLIWGTLRLLLLGSVAVTLVWFVAKIFVKQ